MGQICFDLLKLYWWLDLVGFLMGGMGALFILGSVVLTRNIKLSDGFEPDDQVDQYISEMTAKRPWVRRFVWWLISKGNLLFLLVSSIGFLMQIPAKIWS